MKVRRVWIDRNKTAQFYGQLGQLVVQVGPLLGQLVVQVGPLLGQLVVQVGPLGLFLSGFLYLVL